jgi:hypothetical protein
MATGYTAQLQSMDYDTLNWLRTVIPRAMGMCANLRDAQSNMSVEQIRDGIQENLEYYENRIRDNNERRAEYETLAQAGWEERVQAEAASDLKRWRIRHKEWTAAREGHLSALADVDKLILKTDDPITLQVLGFAAQQLQLVIDYDYLPNHAPKAPDSRSWKELRKYSLESTDNTYYEKELKKAQDRNTERLNAFDNYIATVDKLTQLKK